jgi:hypothetical protein
VDPAAFLVIDYIYNTCDDNLLQEKVVEATKQKEEIRKKPISPSKRTDYIYSIDRHIASDGVSYCDLISFTKKYKNKKDNNHFLRKSSDEYVC